MCKHEGVPAKDVSLVENGKLITLLTSRTPQRKLLQSNGRTVSINYLVRGGRVVDIYLNGTISDLALRRDEFASIIASSGADGLIKKLQERTDNLLGK